ncbi:MAG: ActD protein [Myxococcaceae bacterium]
MTTTTARTPDWMVERIALGELPPGELERARAKLLSEPDGAARLAQLEASNASILETHTPETVVAEVGRREHLGKVRAAHASRSAQRRWSPMVFALPAAAIVALFVVTQLPQQEGSSTSLPALLDEGTRIKGLDAGLKIHRRRGSESEELRTGARVRAGDVLQLSYLRSGSAYGFIASLDGAGAITVHLPRAGAGAAELHGSGAVPLDHAYELDDAPGFERFFFVTSSHPFDTAAVTEAIRALAKEPGSVRTGSLALPSGLQQSSFLVEKDSR